MSRTPIERLLAGIYRGGMLAVGITIVGVLFYLGNVLLFRVGVLERPILLLFGEVEFVFIFFISAAGLFVSAAMVGLIFSELLASRREEDVLIVVLLGSVAIGFGMAAFYYSFLALVRIAG